MQTFLPYPDFAASAAVLDRQRLGKQRVEALQILTALTTGKGWIHHPATRMWQGHEPALLRYQTAICGEWTSRGYRDTCLGKSLALHPGTIGPDPVWLGDPAFHRAHRSNLLRKNPTHYTPFFGNDLPDDLPYIWPIP